MEVHLVDSKDFAFQGNDTTERDAHLITIRSTHRHNMRTFISTHGSRATAEKLYAQGIDFLYGMLFHRIFSLNLSSNHTPKIWADPSTLSVAVRSENADDGPSLVTVRSPFCSDWSRRVAGKSKLLCNYTDHRACVGKGFLSTSISGVKSQVWFYWKSQCAVGSIDRVDRVRTPHRNLETGARSLCYTGFSQMRMRRTDIRTFGRWGI
jgi:hypothetical protein